MLRNILGRLRLPIIASPLFIVSDPRLVVAQCRAGVIGSFPALNARPQGFLGDWIDQIEEGRAAHDETNPSTPSAPFAVNQICHSSNDRLFGDLEVCVRKKVRLVITSLRPPRDLVKEVQGYGGMVLHDVVSLRHAMRAVEDGVDALIAVAAGAGGHAGTVSPFALVSEIRSRWNGPLGLAGAIGNGSSILAARALGADFAYIGTPFIATHEANAQDAYKSMIVDTQASDVVYTDFFSGIPANYLRPSIQRAGFDADNLPAGERAGLNFRSGGEEPAKVWRDIWSAGHGVGSTTKMEHVAALVDRWAKEYQAAFARL